MSDASLAIQTAIFAALAAALTPVKVYDHAPQNQAFPYVTIGDDTQIDWSSKSMRGEEHTLTIHTWSRARGRKYAKELLADIKEALHEVRLTLTGNFNVLTRFDFAQTFLDEDGITYHGVIRFRALTHQN